MAKISIVDNKVTIVTVGTQGLAGAGGIPNGDKGDISVSGNGAGLTINLGVVNNSKLEDMPSKTYKGRTSALTGTPEDVPVSTLKSDLLLTKADVGLANVDNTSDLAKPISTASQTALDLKAPILNPMFTGTVGVASFSPGSIIFADTGGILQQSASDLFFDKANKRVGFGTTTPQTPIEQLATLNQTTGPLEGTQHLVIGDKINITVNPSSNPASTTNYFGFRLKCDIPDTNSVSFAQGNTLIGADIWSVHNGTGTLNEILGCQTVGHANTPGIVGNIWGSEAAPLIENGTVTQASSYFSRRLVSGGSVDSLFALKIHPPEISGTGTVTNNYGVYIVDIQGGTAQNWNIFSVGPSPNYFGGNVAIGGPLAFPAPQPAPTATLDVTGTAKVSSTLSVGSTSQFQVSSTGVISTTALSTGIVHSNSNGQLSSSLVSLVSEVTGTLPIGNGGTNSTILGAAGTIPYSNGTGLAYSAAGTAGQALISGAGLSPTWFAPTAGSVLFAGTSGALSQDNANIFWDNATKRLGIGLNAPSSILDIKGTSLTDLPSYGAEFLSSTGWTSTDWTGDFATGWTHTPGNTSILSQSNLAVINTKYQITCTITNRTAGSLIVSFGGQVISAGLTTSGAFGPTTITTDGLQITPTSDFDGTIVISIRAITAGSQPVIRLKSSDNQIRFEMRAIQAGNNLFLGTGAGGYTTTGTDNIAVGSNALLFNTTGRLNIAIGTSTLSSNTTGQYNTAIGYASSSNSTTGSYNTAIGTQSLNSNSTGTGNTALGVNALYQNTAGGYNVAIGYGAGYNASTPNQINTNCVLLGRETNCSIAGVTNSIAIGYNAQVSASNQVVLGNSSITSTTLRGNIDATGGYVKVKSYTVATVPSASASGAGAVIYVSNAAIGGTLAWSDGTNWKTPSAIATLA